MSRSAYSTAWKVYVKWVIKGPLMQKDPWRKVDLNKCTSQIFWVKNFVKGVKMWLVHKLIPEKYQVQEAFYV